MLRDVFLNRPEIGWFISSIYLVCGALRLARFNCTAAMPGSSSAGKEFLGFPIPAAAGLVASVTYFFCGVENTDADFFSARGGASFCGVDALPLAPQWSAK